MKIDPMRARRVLVFPGGTEIALEILASLRHVRGVQLFAAGQDVSNHARFAFADYHPLPHVGAADWLQQLKGLCARLRIDAIFPAHDDALVALSRHADELPTVLAPDFAVCALTRSKRATYRALEGVVPVPAVHADADTVTQFPVFVKPDRGQGSKDARAVADAAELRAALAATEDPLICELLPGEEYTVDCFSSARQGLLFAGARQRVRTRNGISVNTRRVELPQALALARAIGERLGLRGAWFFQLKRRASGELALLEVAPRIAGAMALHRAAGVNFAHLTLLERDEVSLAVMPSTQPVELDRCLHARYRHALQFRTLYLDLDDTLIEAGRVNLDLIRLVFASINAGRRIVLLTRHAGDLQATLARHRLAGLFDRIVHLTDGSPKSAHIDDRDAIYVDDSFSERRDVALRCGIPTLDCSMIDFLIDQAESLVASPNAPGE